ncbi:Gfo/Idh/MocA family oxidoreductase [Membranihabitans marinus]
MPNLFANQHRKKEKRLGIAILGLGGYGGGQVAPALLETKYCYLAGIVTGSPEKIPEWQEKYNIPDKNVYNYDNFDSIADNSDIDIVYVVTPNALHMPFVLRAAAAGKHVICEKPMDISSANCQIMMDACKKAKRKLQIGYRLRYEPRHLKLMELAKTKPFGKIQSIDTNFSFYGINNSNWRFTDPALSGGGPLMDIGIYCLDACRYATGLEPLSITAQKYKTVMDKLPGMEESIFWQMTFDDGIVANCGTSYVARRNYIWISAEKGNYGIEPAFSYRGLVGKIKDQVMEDTSTVRQQALQMDAYAQNILMDTEVVASGEHGKQDMIYIEAIYEAAETGKTILF